MPSVSVIAERYKKLRSPIDVHKQDVEFLAWAVLVSTIISLRTKDEVTAAASERLLGLAESPQALLKLNQSQIEKLIYPAGFYHTKAANLIKISQILIAEFDGKVPSDIDELLPLPGVGRKTANLVVIEAFDKDGICVDTHVHRISNRCGWVKTKKADDTEMQLRKILPKKFWKRINALLVLYGQNVCRPISPFCSKCIIRDQCAKISVKKER